MSNKPHRRLFVFALVLLVVTASVQQIHAAKWNGFGLKWYTIETEHFNLHYHHGLDASAKEAGTILERLYGIYRNTYRIVLPGKTDIYLVNAEQANGWAWSSMNVIKLMIRGPHDWMDRGTGDWLENLVAHEYAHIVSIWLAQKLPSAIPYVQFGYFSHPNSTVRHDDGGSTGLRFEIHRLFPQENLPPWFTEGIAQYGSMKHGSDRWDANRDMIMRTLTLSDKLLTWDHMSVFTGRGDDYEKVYNHGFSLVTYIAETYGVDRIVAMLRESGRLYRLNFDGAIKATLGISGRELYREWKKHLQQRYSRQLDSLGSQVYGKKINKHGFNNVYPRFGPDGETIYFQSNGKSDSYRTSFLKYMLSDTVDSAKRIQPVSLGVRGDYDIHDSSGLVVFTSRKSEKSQLAASRGGLKLKDAFIDTLPPEKKPFRLFAGKTERQVTEKKSLYAAAFSPTGDMLAASRWRVSDEAFLCLMDTSGKSFRQIYPPEKNGGEHRLRMIYSVDWSSDGHRIAISFLDRGDRKVGVYDTLDGTLTLVCDSEHDERDPRFSPDGSALYFSSDRTGIFNLYRYSFDTEKLQRITNVSGGAFMPDVSPDGNKVTYVNYDENGYGVYLLDTVKAVETVTPRTPLVEHGPVPQPKSDVTFSGRRRYSRYPRKFVFIPSLFAEQTVTELEDAFKGRTTVKGGGVVQFFDPLALEDAGTEFGGYLLLDPSKAHKFIDINRRIFNPDVDYDIGAFGYTSLLPLDLSISIDRRGITGQESFYDEGWDSTLTLSYNMSPKDYRVIATHDFENGFKLHGMASYNSYDVYIYIDEILRSDWIYTPAQGSRLSLFTTMLSTPYTRTGRISPKGMYFKARYDFWNQRLMNEEKGVVFDEGIPRENYDRFQFHELMASVKSGFPSPWYDKHDLYAEVKGTTVRLTEQCKEGLRDKGLQERLPSFYEPVAWVPGYAYYYRDTLSKANGGDSLSYDTVLVSGPSLLEGMLSYRFPPWPGSLDKKLGWVYLDNLYGAFNVAGATAFDRPTDIMEVTRDNILLSVGGEIRLEATSFSLYPLYVKLKADYGLDHPAPLGGLHLGLSFGMGFDEWGYIDEPDYHRMPVGLNRR